MHAVMLFSASGARSYTEFPIRHAEYYPKGTPRLQCRRRTDGTSAHCEGMRVELMAERGVAVTYDTIRGWCYKFGQDYAKRIRARRGQLGDTCHLDEVYLKIGGCLQYLWRAVDQDGSVLDIRVQPHRDTKAAVRFFRKLLRGLKYAPRVVVTAGMRNDSCRSLAFSPICSVWAVTCCRRRTIGRF